MTEERETIAAPPYVAWKTFLGFLDWLAEVGVPSRLDRSFWGQKLSGAYGAQVIAALKYFDLLDAENRPQPDLEVLVTHPEQRKEALHRLIQKKYSDVLDDLDLERATAGELVERFRQYPISGETFNKALNFFVQATQYAGIPTSQHITKRARGAAKAGSGSGKPRRRGRPPKAKSAEGTAQPHVSTVEQLGMHPSIEALLRDLNRIGASWTQPERDRWLSTFTTMLDYVYPVKER